VMERATNGGKGSKNWRGRGRGGRSNDTFTTGARVGGASEKEGNFGGLEACNLELQVGLRGSEARRGLSVSF